MILIAAGSNLPFCENDSQRIVLGAISALGRFVEVKSVSSLYQTPAWPDPNDPPFINATAEVVTNLSPQALMAALHAIEAGFGRKRGPRNAPRTLDLDLLAYGEIVRTGPPPELPHPRLQDREFVLAPLCDIAPGWRHPVTGRSAQEMLDALPERQAVRIS
jgi:2-amino-4-hydroxy-6-hydroxymethyldihydropteridine diphosphokinase